MINHALTTQRIRSAYSRTRILKRIMPKLPSRTGHLTTRSDAVTCTYPTSVSQIYRYESMFPFVYKQSRAVNTNEQTRRQQILIQHYLISQVIQDGIYYFVSQRCLIPTYGKSLLLCSALSTRFRRQPCHLATFN